MSLTLALVLLLATASAQAEAPTSAQVAAEAPAASEHAQEAEPSQPTAGHETRPADAQGAAGHGPEAEADHGGPSAGAAEFLEACAVVREDGEFALDENTHACAFPRWVGG